MPSHRTGRALKDQAGIQILTMVGLLVRGWRATLRLMMSQRTTRTQVSKEGPSHLSSPKSFQRDTLGEVFQTRGLPEVSIYVNNSTSYEPQLRAKQGQISAWVRAQ